MSEDLGLNEGVESKEVTFTVTGSFLLNAKLEPQYAVDGSVCGYLLPDGRNVSLVVALEVANLHGMEPEYVYVTNEREMDTLGFCCLDYDRTDFCDESADTKIVKTSPLK